VPSDNTQSASENLESRFERVLKPNARKSVPAHDAFDRTTGEIQQMFGWTNKLVGIGALLSTDDGGAAKIQGIV